MTKKSDMSIYPGGLTWFDQDVSQVQPIDARSKFRNLAKTLRFQLGLWWEIFFGPAVTLVTMLLLVLKVLALAAMMRHRT